MAGRIPQQFIDDLVSRVDIVEIIDERVPLKKAGREFVARCPFHDEKTPSFTVSRDKQFYHCFGCGAHGTAIGFLMDYAHMSFVEAIQELAGQIGMEVPSTGSSVQAGADHSGLYRILEEAAAFFRAQLREHSAAGRAVAYLKGRGLSGRVAAAFGVGYAPPRWDSLLKELGTDATRIEALGRAGLIIEGEGSSQYDRFRDRIMFPILDRRGRTVGFGGRVIGDGTPKYLNSPETPVFHKGREVYGLYQAREKQATPAQLLVVEGYMDVITLAQFHITNAVATLGTAITSEHLQQLFRSGPEVVFCFDGDEAGRRAAWRALETSLPSMREGRQAAFMFLPEGEDPDSLIRSRGTEKFRELVANARPLSNFFFEHLTAQVNMATLDGRARLVELSKPYLNRLPAGAFQQLMTERLAELSELTPASLTRLIRGGPARNRKTKQPHPGHGQAPSLIRKTIVLLLHDPALAQTVNDVQDFGALELPGAGVLRQVLELLRSQPHLSLAGVVEHFRETEIGSHLSKLALMEDPSTYGADQEREFRDAIEKLRSKLKEQRFSKLQHKARAASLTEEEKREYVELLHGRNSTRGKM